MELAELARWTPIRFDLSGPVPTVDWADLSQERFVEPFFDQAVARWASGPRARPLVRTGLEALVILYTEPSLEPAGMIFHLSRCGSPLVSRLLGTLPGTVVIAEPSPLNALLGLDPGRAQARRGAADPVVQRGVAELAGRSGQRQPVAVPGGEPPVEQVLTSVEQLRHRSAPQGLGLA